MRTLLVLFVASLSLFAQGTIDLRYQDHVFPAPMYQRLPGACTPTEILWYQPLSTYEMCGQGNTWFPYTIITVSSDPAGSCQTGLQALEYNDSNGHISGCEAGTWQLVSGSGGTSATTYCAPSSASGSAYTCSGTQGGGTAPSSLTGLSLLFAPDVNNTGAFTIKVGALAAVSALTSAGGAPSAAFVTAGNFYSAAYNGTNFVVTPATGPAGATGVFGPESGAHTVNYTANVSSYPAGDCNATIPMSGTALVVTLPLPGSCSALNVINLSTSSTVSLASSGGALINGTTTPTMTLAATGAPSSSSYSGWRITATPDGLGWHVWSANGPTGAQGPTGGNTNFSTPGTSHTMTGAADFFVCTGICTITVPIPVAGYQYCIANDDNVSTVITLAAIGSSARYENTARTAYGTAGTGTFVSGGAAGDAICIIGRDSTHYLTISHVGTWTAN